MHHEDDVSRRRVTLEFAALMAAGLIAYALQAVSETVGQILAIPLYVAFAVFFWHRGEALAEVNGSVVSAVFGRRLGKASEAFSAFTFRLCGGLALLSIPVSIVLYLVAR
jgi:hypothetical protein